MLVVFRPFHIGDRVETGGVGGTAREINLFFTEIDGDDNTRVIIPNGKLWGEIVKVPTRNDTARLGSRPPARQRGRRRRSGDFRSLSSATPASSACRRSGSIRWTPTNTHWLRRSGHSGRRWTR